MKNYRIEIKWAFIFIVFMLLWMVMEKLTGLHDQHIEMHPIVTNFVAIPAILIYIFALRDKRSTDFGGSMTYKQGFISGLIMTLIITVFTPLMQYITSTVITPDFFDTMISYSVEKGYYETKEAAEAYFNLKNYIISSTLFTPVMGIVTTAIVMIFLRKK